MYRKKLLTVAVSMALITGCYTVGSASDDAAVKIEHTEHVDTAERNAENAAGEASPAPVAENPEPPKQETPPPKQETPPPAQTEAPPPVQTEAPPVQTEAPPVQTEAPPVQTEAPPVQTEAPPPVQTETQPPVQTEPETQLPVQPDTPSETQPPQTETSSQGSTDGPSETEGQTSGQPETQLPTETQTEQGSEHPSESGDTSEGESESQPGESESESESETDPQEDEESESETSEYGSNEELIAHQNIVIPPKLELEFRFTQAEKQYALIRNSEGASVYEKKSDEAREVGVLEYYGLCYILDDAGDGWYYIESGNVRGFVKTDAVVAGETAERIVRVKGLNDLPLARLTVARTENAAFTYTHTTVQEVLASKVYAVAGQELEIREQRKADSRVTGTLRKGGLCYILADSDKEWVFVESDDVRGFVKKSSLVTGSAAKAKVNETGEANMALADLKVKPEDNKACYYTFTSVREASQESRTRESIVNFALQFLGNPYVWGGTSLTNGADCSGFVQSVYAYYGYSLPRVADAQSVYGMQIPISSAEPGDLIFYAKNGYVYHVSMYIGNGQVVHAAGKNLGIITSGISGNAVWATRIIS